MNINGTGVRNCKEIEVMFSPAMLLTNILSVLLSTRILFSHIIKYILDSYNYYFKMLFQLTSMILTTRCASKVLNIHRNFDNITHYIDLLLYAHDHRQNKNHPEGSEELPTKQTIFPCD